MGLNTKQQKHLPIGVDLGTSTLKMAQLRCVGNTFELMAAGSVEVPREYYDDLARRLEFQCEKIRGILRSGGFKGREAIVALPAEAVFLQPVRIQMVPPAEIDQAIKQELEGKLPYPVEDAVIRNILAGTVYADGKDMHERIVVAVSRSDLDSHLALLRRAGLDVVGVNIEATAVVECFARVLRRVSDESRVTLFIDIGSASTQVVLAHGQNTVFARNLPVGGQILDRTVADALQISTDQAHTIRRQMPSEAEGEEAEDELFLLLDAKIAEMTDKITECVRYYESVFRNKPIEQVIFVGGQAHNKRFCQSIAQRLNMPAQVGDPMAGIQLAEQGGWGAGLDGRQPNPSWAVAIGLSLGATVAA
jgi:type IV pilus assembly protein PilM